MEGERATYSPKTDVSISAWSITCAQKVAANDTLCFRKKKNCKAYVKNKRTQRYQI